MKKSISSESGLLGGDENIRASTRDLGIYDYRISEQ